jgi:pyruvate dehydrogenase E2 component (dihydrolipoamide acetyltransferase)
MPRLSDSMEEGTVLRWLKSVGDQVAVGDELVEIETDKANAVYESDLDGTIVEFWRRRRHAPSVTRSRGSGTRVSFHRGAAGALREGRRARPAPCRKRRRPPRPRRHRPSPAGVGDGRVKASPIARRITRIAARSARLSGSARAGGSSRPTSSGRSLCAAPAAGAPWLHLPRLRPARLPGGRSPRPPRARSR